MDNIWLVPKGPPIAIVKTSRIKQSCENQGPKATLTHNADLHHPTSSQTMRFVRIYGIYLLDDAAFAYGSAWPGTGTRRHAALTTAHKSLSHCLLWTCLVWTVIV